MYFAWLMWLIDHSFGTWMHYPPFQLISAELDLFSHSHSNHSLWNTTREHSSNAWLPTWSVLREDMPNRHSLWNKNTLQHQRSVCERTIPYLDFLQCRHFPNPTHGIIREGIMSNLQCFQWMAISQMETPTWIRATTILALRETPLSNHHTLQFLHAD